MKHSKAKQNTGSFKTVKLTFSVPRVQNNEFAFLIATYFLTFMLVLRIWWHIDKTLEAIKVVLYDQI